MQLYKTVEPIKPYNAPAHILGSRSWSTVTTTTVLTMHPPIERFLDGLFTLQFYLKRICFKMPHT